MFGTSKRPIVSSTIAVVPADFETSTRNANALPVDVHDAVWRVIVGVFSPFALAWPVATENSIQGVTPGVSSPKTGSEGCVAELDIEEALASLWG